MGTYYEAAALCGVQGGVTVEHKGCLSALERQETLARVFAHGPLGVSLGVHGYDLL